MIAAGFRPPGGRRPGGDASSARGGGSAESASMKRACLIDALGTTVRLAPPWERLDPNLVDGLPPARVRAAFEREMAHYAAHAGSARDAASLAELRGRCAEVLSQGLGREVAVEALMAAIAFEAFPEAPRALADLRRRGLKLACVSNWDYELRDVLCRVGLAPCFDLVLSSAEAGAAKPDPAIFERALAALDCLPADALHVGDGPADVEGARAAGIEVLLIDRAGGGDIASLDEIVDHLRR